MSLPIQGNSLFLFDRTLSHEDVQHAINSSSKEEATYIGVWEKIKDWLCGTNKSEALKHIYELTHNNDGLSNQEVFKKIVSFHKLSEMVYPSYKDKFQASIKQEKENCIFTFSITGVIDEHQFVYGVKNTKKDISAIKEAELTNKSGFLETNNLKKSENVFNALDKISYMPNGEIKGISAPTKEIYFLNKRNFHLNLLNDFTKEKMVQEPRIIQEWISLQIKCFDYYNNSAQRYIDVNEVFDTRRTPKEWLYKAYANLHKIEEKAKKEVIKFLAEEFNSQVIWLYQNPFKERFHSSYELHNQPIHLESYNQSNEPIYEEIQFNSSQISSNKYYKGPINGDIYAKVDKTNVNKPELLKEIDNFILENRENYPSAY
ncbi:hypothetical protein [Candidatus Arsenophonus triatominarum]|uniref:hypothetical protein n=1 Tax=Candidatus Arsenophonus triatominarum TaxID=57911 RepID=UPI0007C54A9E|nr:hypothetical protein [Candidatus Arsenophonus triatominarum]